MFETIIFFIVKFTAYLILTIVGYYVIGFTITAIEWVVDTLHL